MPQPFLIEVFGEFGPDRLRINWHDEPRPPHPTLDALVAGVWREQVEARCRAGGMLYNGRLARCLRYRVTDGVLTIDAGPTDYANFMATNLLNHARGDEFGWDLFSNPIGTSGIPITSDGRILLGRRNQRVAYHGGCVHTFGGGLEAGERRPDGAFDAFESIRRELHEELRLADEEIGRVVCLGLIRDPTIRQPELVFDIALRLTWAEVAKRFNPADPQQEHKALLACGDRPDAILPFIRSSTPMTPVAVGALCLHGRTQFGESWYAQLIREWDSAASGN